MPIHPPAPRDRAVMHRALIVRRLLLAGAISAGAAGCAEPAYYRQPFDHRVLPPSVAVRQQPQQLPKSGAVKQARAELPLIEPVPASPAPDEPNPPVTDGRSAPGPLSLPDAVALAYRNQPRLRVFLEGVVQ